MAGVWHNTANRGFFYGPSSNNPWNNDIGWKDSVAKESKIAARYWAHLLLSENHRIPSLPTPPPCPLPLYPSPSKHRAKMFDFVRRFAENQVSGNPEHRISTGRMSVRSRPTNTSSSLDSGRFRLSTRQAAILQELDRLNKDEQMMVLRDAIGHKLSATEQISLLRDTLRSAETDTLHHPQHRS
jgi:hypothetical protein